MAIGNVKIGMEINTKEAVTSVNTLNKSFGTFNKTLNTSKDNIALVAHGAQALTGLSRLATMIKNISSNFVLANSQIQAFERNLSSVIAINSNFSKSASSSK